MILFLDAGHGGVDSFGKYTTFPDKCFKHKMGEFHRGSWFYEGVSNRFIADILAAKVNAALKDVKIIRTYHPVKDTPLSSRSTYVNEETKRIGKPALFISIHSDASVEHRASGFTVYTSPGKTKADEFGEMVFKSVKSEFGKEIKYRTDLSDEDHDKEERFHVLVKTNVPAVLLEWLFFDNYNDALKIVDVGYANRYCNAILSAIKVYFNNLEGL